MVPEAWAASDSYGALQMPVVIVAGSRDRLIDTAKQSARLHKDVGHSSFHAVAGAGHMVHQTATSTVMARSMRRPRRRHDHPNSLPRNERRRL
jgi:pimeloyl-ACP methyl ester carboxylesterase